MKNTETKSKTQLEPIPKTENQKENDTHKKEATHFDAAAKSHSEALKQNEKGNQESATKSAKEALEHSRDASEVQKENVKHHTSKF